MGVHTSWLTINHIYHFKEFSDDLPVKYWKTLELFYSDSIQ